MQLVSLMRLQAAGMHPIHGWMVLWSGALGNDVGAVLGLVWLLGGLLHLWDMLCLCGYFPRKGLPPGGVSFSGRFGEHLCRYSEVLSCGCSIVRGFVTILLGIFLGPSLLSIGDMFRLMSGTSNETK